MDLAQMNRAYLPRWLNIGLWIVAEAAIVATDVGQVSPILSRLFRERRPNTYYNFETL
jgi:thiamine pyrophosphate-dependent acetolactate synthase large subunit-like protein